MTVRRALLHSGIGQYIAALAALFRLVIVSRLLAPSEVGVFAVAMSLIVLARVMRIWGVFDYVIARRDLQRDDLRACFTIVTALAAIAALGFLAAAAPLARFFAAPALEQIVLVLVIGVAISPLGLITAALMNREMRFGELALIQAASAIVDSGVTIWLAASGFGPISLAWGNAAGQLTSLAVLLCLDRSSIVFRPRFRGWGRILRFGLPNAGSTLLTHLGQQLPPLLIGRSLGLEQTGFFNRGQAPVEFFRQAIEQATTRVAHSWFAAKSRNEPEALAASYVTAISVNSGLSWPFYAVLLFNAGTLVPLLLGPQWTESVPVAQAIAAGAMLSAHTLYGQRLMTGRGLVVALLRFDALGLALRLALMVAAMPYGLTAFAMAYAVGALATAGLMWLTLRRAIGLGLRRTLWSMRRSVILLAAISAVQIGFIGSPLSAEPQPLLRFAVQMATTGAVWLATMALIRHELWAAFAPAGARLWGRLVAWMRRRA